MLCHVLEVTSDPDEHIKRRLHLSSYLRTKFIKDYHQLQKWFMSKTFLFIKSPILQCNAVLCSTVLLNVQNTLWLNPIPACDWQRNRHRLSLSFPKRKSMIFKRDKAYQLIKEHQLTGQSLSQFICILVKFMSRYDSIQKRLLSGSYLNCSKKSY